MAKQAVEMTQAVMQPVAPTGYQESQPHNAADTWTCSCGQSGNNAAFCPNCGAKKPEGSNTWDCSCGQRGNTKNFCPACGARRPSASLTWDCSCGQKGNTRPFCPSCGNKRP